MEISLLLTLPSTSKGLGSLRSSVAEHGSASPRRKIPRLDTDSDITSSSRSNSKTLDGPISIQVLTDDNAPKVARVVLEKEQTSQLGRLRRCIQIILTPTEGFDEPLPSGTSYENIYSECRSIVTVHDAGAGLYHVFCGELQKALNSLTLVLIDAKEDDVAWIGLLACYCKWFETQISLLKSLLTYLDQVYIVNTPNVASIHDEAYGLFSERIFGNIQVTARLRTALSSWLEWERENHAPHESRENVPNLVKYLTIHNQFNAFEQHYMDITQEYFCKESDQDPHDDPLAFLTHVQARIYEEQVRAEETMPLGSWDIIRQVTETSLLDGRVEWLSKSLLGSLMDAKNIVTTGEMYSLFSRVGTLEPLEKAFQDYIRKNTENIVADSARDEEMVQRLLDLKALADDTISTSFLIPSKLSPSGPGSTLDKIKDQKFTYALDNAFTYGFRARRSKPAEMIAKYLHQLLRKGQGSLSNAEYESLLEAALALYRFSEDKDVFRTFYHRSLAKRLLVGRSASDDVELAMLKKLKEKYDPEFGMGEDMFKDLTLSKELMKDYLARKAKDSETHKLNVVVLQRSAWPFSVPKKLADLPPKMQNELSNYTEYYKAKHAGRVLDWDHALGTATLKARFENGVIKELSVSLYQAIVLLLFNDEEEIHLRDIAQRLRMHDAELRRTLQSLACGKKKVLKKVPPGRDVEDEDVFRFNADFDDPHARVHINSIQAKVSPEESQKTNESIEGDRKSFLDAAIVRVMKAKKEMTYEQLKAATIDAVKNHFVPTVDLIKKRIDSLVESEYLRRSDEDRHMFFYVA